MLPCIAKRGLCVHTYYLAKPGLAMPGRSTRFWSASRLAMVVIYGSLTMLTVYGLNSAVHLHFGRSEVQFDVIIVCVKT